MKTITLILCMSLASLGTAQYDAFTYQGLLLDDQSAPLANSEVEFLATITNEQDDIYYQESHLTRTDENGVISLRIGRGEVLDGSFSDIDWLAGISLVEIQYDLNDGKGIRFLGKQRFKSVLFCLESSKVVCQDGLPGPEGDQGAMGATGGGGWQSTGPAGAQGRQGPAGNDGLNGVPIMERLDTPPAINIWDGTIYLDDGTNRADGLPGFRYYDGQSWIDLG